MKILTILTTRFDINGITKVVENNYYHLNKEKFNVDFAVLNKPNDRFCLEVVKNKGNIYILPQRMSNPLKYIISLLKILRDNDYDAIHVHGNSSTLAIETILAWINRIPVRLAHIHSTKTKYPLLNLLLKLPFLLTCTNRIAVSNEAGKKIFGKNFNLLPNGIAVEKFYFDEVVRLTLRNKLDLTNENKVLGNVGRFSKEKNQIYLIELLENLLLVDSNYRLLLVGEGELLQNYIDLVKEKNLEDKVIFCGSQNDVSPYLFAMDLMVVPSFFEGLGITLLEGQASDLKCFASSNIPVEANVTSSILYFDLEDKLKLEKSIINTFKHYPIKREKHEHYNILLNSQYNIENSIEELEKLYLSASSNKY
ncbi:glycosyltransferase [Fundicoccus ignavus]|uniref:Glycosyltransferase n=1 Tax=Fundicoccus ignavus TaxID=2664442 RepID=A0A844CBP2_9LACT|nr:glycosyltransferase [Fundicoccus ignavus]MRJ46911.1 glycosyltransferase [Fundicoccus ignavus]